MRSFAVLFTIVLSTVLVLLVASLAHSQSLPGWEKLPKGMKIELADRLGNYTQRSYRMIFYSKANTIDSVIDESPGRISLHYTSGVYVTPSWAYTTAPGGSSDRAAGSKTLWAWDSISSQWKLNTFINVTSDSRTRAIEAMEIWQIGPVGAGSKDTVNLRELYRYNDHGYLEHHEIQMGADDSPTIREYHYTYNSDGTLSTMTAIGIGDSSIKEGGDPGFKVSYSWKDGKIDEMRVMENGASLDSTLEKVFTNLRWADSILPNATTIFSHFGLYELFWMTDDVVGFESDIAPRRTLLSAQLTEGSARTITLDITPDSTVWIEHGANEQKIIEYYFEDGSLKRLDRYSDGQLESRVSVHRTYNDDGTIGVQETFHSSFEGGER